MDVGQACQRILRNHALVVVAALLAGLAAVVSMHRGEQPVYEASARVSLSAAAVRSAAEAEAVAARARGLATSRRAAEGALRATGIERSPEHVAENVTVTALGTSTVASVTVRDTVPEVATRLADAVAAQVVALYDRASSARLALAVRQADKQAAELEARRTATQRIAAGGDPVRRAGAQQRLATLDRELEAVRTLRRELSVATAQQPGAELLDPASTPSRPLPSSLPQDAVVALLVALLLGCGLAASLEALHPTLVGSRAVATALQVPLLAELRRGVTRTAGPDRALLAAAVRVAARRRGIDRLLVLPAVPAAQTAELVDLLRAPGPAPSAGDDLPEVAVQAESGVLVGGCPSASRTASHPPLSTPEQGQAATGAGPQSDDAEAALDPALVRATPLRLLVPPLVNGALHPLLHRSGSAASAARDELSPGPGGGAPVAPSVQAPAPAELEVEQFDVAALTGGGGREAATGLLVLSPRDLRASALDRIGDVVHATGWPVLGVVTHGRQRRWTRTRGEHA